MRVHVAVGRRKIKVQSLVFVALACDVAVLAQSGQASPPPDEAPYLRDRGIGVATSMFGTYVRGGEWLFYPFFEYYHDSDLEYAPEEFGVPGDQDYRGRYRAQEGLFFVSYGLTNDLAVEIEVAAIHASFEKSLADPSWLPPKIVESGLGDVEGQLRWRWRKETAKRPELFSYAELVVPHHGDRPLTGTPGWEIKMGSGVTRGFSWGTLTGGAAFEYDTSSTSPVDLGEYALEYLKRLSPSWRVLVAIEGTPTRSPSSWTHNGISRRTRSCASTTVSA
jgi:hypothetical protein